MISLDFLLASLFVVLIPGTGVIYTISIALSKGKVSSFYAAIGCTFGIIPHIILTLVSISFLFSFNNNIFLLLKYLGFIYLLYLAYGLYKNEKGFNFNDNKTSQNKSILIKGFLINILNPKLTIFLVAFFPQFISSDSTNIIYEILEGSFIFMFLTLIIFIIYGICASYLAYKLLNNESSAIYIQKIFAFCFVLLAISIVL